eukprot:470661_1
MTTVTTVTTPTAGQIRKVFRDPQMELIGWWKKYLETLDSGERYPLNSPVKDNYYLHDALALVEPIAKRGGWNENLKFMIKSSLLLTEPGNEEEMKNVYEIYIKREETKESEPERHIVNIDAQSIKDFKKCEEEGWKDSTGKLIDSTQKRVVWPEQFMFRPHHLGPICYPGLWRQAVNVVKGSTAQQWNDAMSEMARKANAPTEKVLDFVKHWGPLILGEAQYRDAAAHSGHFNHLSTFNNHYEPYPHRYQVGDYDRDEHTESRQSYANANAIAFDNSAHYDHLVYGDEYAEQRSLGGYMPMYGYEHVHPLVQPQLSTSNGNDSMQYGLMIIGLALFIFLMLCVTFTVLSGVCFAIGRVSNARKSDKIPYEVIEELTV